MTSAANGGQVIVILGGGGMTQTGYSILFEEKEDYLLAKVDGKRTRENVINLTKEVFAKAVESGKRKVITNVKNLSGRLGVVDDYYLVTDLFAQLRGKGINKAAIIDIEESPIHEWFLEIVAKNQGYNLKVFTEGEAAIEWLKK